MICARATASRAGTGTVFHVNVLANLKSDLMRPPVVRCHVMNMDDESSANRDPSGSGITELASPLMIWRLYRAAMKYRRVASHDECSGWMVHAG